MRPKLMRHLSSASECSRTHRMAIIGLKLMINASSRSEEHTSELQSHLNLVCRLLLEKKKKKQREHTTEHIENRILHKKKQDKRIVCRLVNEGVEVHRLVRSWTLPRWSVTSSYSLMNS